MVVESKSTSQKEIDGSGAFDLGAAVVISDVLDLHKRIVDTLSNKNKIVFDGSNIEQIDGSGLQLLVSVAKQAASQEVEFKWAGASEVLRDNAGHLGLTKALHLDSIEAAD